MRIRAKGTGQVKMANGQAGAQGPRHVSPARPSSTQAEPHMALHRQAAHPPGPHMTPVPTKTWGEPEPVIAACWLEGGCTERRRQLVQKNE